MAFGSRDLHAHGPPPLHDREIRIVDLLPGGQDQAISLDYRVVSLEDNPQYETLSYVWGDRTNLKTVESSGRQIEITLNLFAAFEQLRQPERPRTLWVDQICINQWDNEEKAEQVLLMRDIYKKGTQCLIWLGEIPETGEFSAQDAETALDFIHCMADPETQLQTRLPILLVDSERGESARKAFRAITMDGNPWWSRIWTVQEALLPVSATLIWGPLSIDWTQLELAARSLTRSRNVSRDLHQRIDRYRGMVESFVYPVRGLTITNAGENPLNLLMRWRYREATDPRDKVYALMGLLPPEQLHLVSDLGYNVSPAALFTRVTLDLILQENGLRAFVGAKEMPHLIQDMPTWAIDFTSRSEVGKHQSRWWNRSHRYKSFSACGNRKLELDALSDNRMLKISGIIVDEVVAVHDVLEMAPTDDVNDEQLINAITSCLEMLTDFTDSRSDDEDYPAGGAWYDAFWRTMIGDLIMREYPRRRAEAENVDKFEQFMDKGIHNRLYESLCSMFINNCFFITKEGYIGIGPPETQFEDKICVLHGGKVPFVIRSSSAHILRHAVVGQEQVHSLVGDAYVHGIMEGEAVEDPKLAMHSILLV